MPSEYQQDYKKPHAYAPKIYNDPNMSDELRDIYRTLESRYVHEGRTIDPSFCKDLSDDSVAKFIAIGFDCLLSLDEQICLGFIFEFYKTIHLDRDPHNHLLIQFKAKQRKKPPPKRAINVGKSKRPQLTTSSSTELPPSDNGEL
ncbi:hypothetical protein Tco_1342707 [Tanacetum coccineum]